MLTINELYEFQYQSLSNQRNLSPKQKKEFEIMKIVLSKSKTNYQPRRVKISRTKKIINAIEDCFDKLFGL